MRETMGGRSIDVGMAFNTICQAIMGDAGAKLYQNGLPAYAFRFRGFPKDNAWREELEKLLQAEQIVEGDIMPEFESFVYVPTTCQGAVEIQINDDGRCDVGGVVSDIEVARKIKEICVRGLPKATPRGSLSILVQTPDGFDIQTVGRIESPFIPQNYSQQVQTDFQHVMDCLASESPCGRLTLFDGPPGTGKSYLIRALATQIHATFVLVAPSCMGQISGPEIMPALLQARNHVRDDEGKVVRTPIVLVMEDADAALIRRGESDRSRLAEVLNLGDGLLGELGDIRIIATTNASKVELDEAIKRPGRMCRHLRVGGLERIRAQELYHKLTGLHLVDPGTTLAEVYRRARQDGWVPVKRSETPGQYV